MRLTWTSPKRPCGAPRKASTYRAARNNAIDRREATKLYRESAPAWNGAQPLSNDDRRALGLPHRGNRETARQQARVPQMRAAAE